MIKASRKHRPADTFAEQTVAPSLGATTSQIGLA